MSEGYSGIEREQIVPKVMMGRTPDAMHAIRRQLPIATHVCALEVLIPGLKYHRCESMDGQASEVRPSYHSSHDDDDDRKKNHTKWGLSVNSSKSTM